jgi:hypothetical protein
MLEFLTGLYSRIPAFMTSYVSRIIQLVLEAYKAGDQADDLIEIRGVLIRSITDNVSTDVCVEALSACWLAVTHTRRTLEMFIVTTSWIVAEGTREDLTASSKLLFEFFLKLFDIRNKDLLKPKVLDCRTF